MNGEPVLFWTQPNGSGWKHEAVKYVVYCFANGERINLEDASKIVAITDKTYYPLPYNDGSAKCVYVVTALNRIQNESKPAKTKLKL